MRSALGPITPNPRRTRPAIGPAFRLSTGDVAHDRGDAEMMGRGHFGTKSDEPGKRYRAHAGSEAGREEIASRPASTRPAHEDQAATFDSSSYARVSVHASIIVLATLSQE